MLRPASQYSASDGSSLPDHVYNEHWSLFAIFRKKIMTATTNTPKRRIVRDFSRRSFVLLYLILFLIPALYLFWYLASVASGSLVPSPELNLGSPGESCSGQMSFYAHLLMSAWKASLTWLPYSVGQYLLGMPSEADQNFVWASGSLLAITFLSVIEFFDLILNPELPGKRKALWTALLLVFAALGVPLPQLIYWFRYMWLEPCKSQPSDSSNSTPVSPSKIFCSSSLSF